MLTCVFGHTSTNIHSAPLVTRNTPSCSRQPHSHPLSARLLAQPCSRRLDSCAGDCRPAIYEVIASSRRPTVIEASPRGARRRAPIPTLPGCDCKESLVSSHSSHPATSTSTQQASDFCRISGTGSRPHNDAAVVQTVKHDYEESDIIGPERKPQRDTSPCGYL